MGAQGGHVDHPNSKLILSNLHWGNSFSQTMSGPAVPSLQKGLGPRGRPPRGGWTLVSAPVCLPTPPCLQGRRWQASRHRHPPPQQPPHPRVLRCWQMAGVNLLRLAPKKESRTEKKNKAQNENPLTVSPPPPGERRKEWQFEGCKLQTSPLLCCPGGDPK